ncbi:hypothetical protein K450DRAFT_300502 [Umbelopsis ramanniana AG]|uniref:Large ribosomal subunit protein mL67 n=1 Tax=Umbelopsis ramanniana AG TaxID=1314678 RepID=A0AAD5E9L6_UMBRA|nr:uncharacterized protein K450DRAFT_300502 [Umbelopsis ramanniana AG]KAI8579199.1 hypothetical protein K450DRAFT_300502 [Umbelopsis ramanniana AG]
MSHSVHLFRHIQTSQVIVSLKKAMKPSQLNQLDAATQPVRLRKDLWRPMVSINGFKDQETAQAVTDALLQRSELRQLETMFSDEHLKLAKRYRGPIEQDIVEKSLVSLREALETIVPRRHTEDSPKLTALWEQQKFADLAGAGEENKWPEFVEHGQLVLKRNRFVKEA